MGLEGQLYGDLNLVADVLLEPLEDCHLDPGVVQRRHLYIRFDIPASLGYIIFGRIVQKQVLKVAFMGKNEFPVGTKIGSPRLFTLHETVFPIKNDHFQKLIHTQISGLF